MPVVVPRSGPFLWEGEGMCRLCERGQHGARLAGTQCACCGHIGPSEGPEVRSGSSVCDRTVEGSQAPRIAVERVVA